MSIAISKGALAMALGLAVPLLAPAAFAADGNGQFATKGVGALTCRQYVEARQSRPAMASAFRNWLDGYLSAVNRYEPQTYDSVPWGSGEVFAVILESHCRGAPDETFVQASQRLVLSTRNDRLPQRSPLITLSADGRSIQIYQEVLRRVQAQLADRGLYNGQLDGQYGPQSRQAIATFQISEGLDGTGLPDPLTVWKLLKP